MQYARQLTYKKERFTLAHSLEVLVHWGGVSIKFDIVKQHIMAEEKC